MKQAEREKLDRERITGMRAFELGMYAQAFPAAAAEKDGETRYCYAGAVNGTVIVLAGNEGAVPAMEAVLATLAVE